MAASSLPASAGRTVPYTPPPAPTAPDPMPALPAGPLVPAQGALFGMHTTPDQSAKDPSGMGITQREQQLGRTMDVDNHYYGCIPTSAAPMPSFRETWDIQQGRIPLVSWGRQCDKAQVASGALDAQLGKIADAFKALGAPFFLRWSWEGDGNQNVGTSHDAQTYIKAWQHLHDLFVAHGVTNAIWVWCPVSLDFYPPAGQTSTDPNLAPDHAINGVGAQPYYPGDAYVDWMCADGYAWGPGLASATRQEPFQELFQAFYDWAAPHNKPMMVGETGAMENNPGDKANWFTAMYQSVKQHFPLIRAFLYFDVVGATNANYDWRIDTTPEALAAFKAMANDPYFNVKATLPPPYGTGGAPSTDPPSGPASDPPSTTTTTTTPPNTGPGPSTAPAGYWMLGSDGAVYPFGDAAAHGDATGKLAAGATAVHIEPTASGAGYWVVDSAGDVTAYGDAASLGGVKAGQLAAGETVTSLSATRSGKGYWLFTNRGRVVPVGDAVSYGDMSGKRLNGPIVGSIATTSGNGYYMVGSDGGIFSFGDAVFHGSMGAVRLNAPVESLVPDASGGGYWLVASDGGIFAFGDAPFRGSMGGTPLNKPVTGMVRYGSGYLMVGQDGGIFDFSDRPFAGSLGAHPPARPIVSVATRG
ncbi:MAG TPA: hypothetical protein VFE55_20715 [Acidimicrobiia bacterium]|nr:hypothetical protein [Acidimicrobiia bacterium]